MIKSIKHKGIEQFYQSGSKAGIPVSHCSEISVLLTALDAATQPQDLVAPNWRLHSLNGSLPDNWAVIINGNWRLIFKLIGEEVEITDYQNYN